MWVVVLLALGLVSMIEGKRNELLPYNPLPNPQSVVQHGNARFTILTPRLIRMEYSSTGSFEDRPTPAVVNRYLTKPSFTQSVNNGFLSIATTYLSLQYQINQPFSSSTLKINSVQGLFRWSFGDRNDGNLLGTIKSLDELDVISLNCTENAQKRVHNEDLHCAWGLISRAGWSVLNDTKNWGINANDWWDSPNTDVHDLYFFGHGDDYPGALFDYSQIGGKTPMVQKNVIGIWWSRWYDLNNRDVKWIVEKYKQLSIPLDVFILDMDWHTKDGWGGYTFDDRLFPIPKATMSWLHDNGLIAGANVHDDDGVRPTEKMYAEMAKAMGVTNGRTIPFAVCSNQTYMLALEDIVLADAENQGMDFWWIDWQQGGKEGGCQGLEQNPTIWLNKIRATDHIRRSNPVRGLVLARWGGMGTHRYQVGFSGDVDHLSWANLAFQPYFSFTSSNVGYGYWSHDLVGSTDHELHTRWLQWGVYSGIFRTHDRGMAVGNCNDNNPPTCAIIEVWNVPAKYFDINRKAMNGRAALGPYIYNAFREAFDTGVSILRPMYYEFPKFEEAYAGDRFGKFGQYMFGPNILVSPITTPALSNNSLAVTSIWIPPSSQSPNSQWFGKENGRLYDGGVRGTVLTNFFDISETPVFVRSGSIIPGIPVRVGNTVGLQARQISELVLTIYPGKSSGETKVYEDDGYTTDYLQGKSVWTTINYINTGTSVTVTIPAVTPAPYVGFPAQRSYIIRLINFVPPSGITVNGVSVPYHRHGVPNSWHYDGEELALVVQTGSVKTSEATRIVINHPSFDQSALYGHIGKMSHCTLAKSLLDETNETPGCFSTQGGYLQRCGSTPELLSYLAGTDAKQFIQTLQGFPGLFDQAFNEVQGLKPSSSPAQVTQKRWAYAMDLMTSAKK